MKFKREFGIGEVLAAIALIVSLISFVMSVRTSRPKVTMETLTTVMVVDENENEKSERLLSTYRFAMPAIFTNRGGSTTSLASIRETRTVRVIIGEEFKNNPEIAVRYGLIEEIINDRKTLAKMVSSKQLMPFESPQLLNISLEPGKQKHVVFIFELSDAKTPLSEHNIAFEAFLQSADGSEFRLAQYLSKE